MAENSKIEWCDHTFNAWIGCTKIKGGPEGSACDFCYAEALVHRYGWAKWGPGELRARTSEANWKKPLTWNRRAEKEGRRYRVFCSSLADVFDAEVLQEWRGDLFELIRQTPHLHWLLLTKRPQVALKFFSDRPDVRGLGNVWLGTTVESQKMADLRIPTLLAVPGIAKRFLSCEPLLGAIDLHDIPWPSNRPTFPETDDISDARSALHLVEGTRLDWVIAGGESGPRARPMHPDWARGLRDQCAAAGVPFFFKQWGEWGPIDRHPMTEAHAIADDGTLYRMSDLSYPDGPRRGEAIRANHDHAHLHTIYRVGKKAAGALLDGKLHREFPT